jgi:hypothetical protein
VVVGRTAASHFSGAFGRVNTARASIVEVERHDFRVFDQA